MADFFEGNEFGKTISDLRYAYFEGETWEQKKRRAADHIARAENDFAKYSEAFYGQLITGRLAPGGRINYGSGRPKAQLINCFVLPCGDSREGWGKLLYETTVISGTGGGIGTNFSTVRPRYTLIAGTGGTATGSVSVMKMKNGVGEQIKGGGGRRAAYMFCLNHDHPDIMEFLNSKLNTTALPPVMFESLVREFGIENIPLDLRHGELNNANISVVFMNEAPASFFEKVKADGDHDLIWQGKIIKTIKARELWNLIVENALKNGEPGVLNGHFANQMSNLHYYKELVSTNPCGEIWMQPYSVCCLGAIVLPRFVTASKAKDLTNRIDWESLHDSVRLGVRFLDDVLDVTHYPIPEVEVESKATRRIGLGVMGLADMLVMLGLRYNSEEGRAFVDRVMSFIKNASYDTSADLAVEKGVFPEYDAVEFLKSGFVKTLKASVRAKIREKGMRNCAVLTIAPTGTTSMEQGVSSGIEPNFGGGWVRTYRNGDGQLQKEIVVHPLFKQLVLAGEDTSHFLGADEIDPEDHLKMQIVCQKHVDNSISKTINLPHGAYTPERLSELYMQYLPQLKGITIYPEGSREDAPLRRISNEEATRHILAGETTAAIDESCLDGVCGI